MKVYKCLDVPIVLVGTKLDLREDSNTLMVMKGKNLIKLSDGEKLCGKLKAVKYFETSSQSKKNTKELIHFIGQHVLDLRKKQEQCIQKNNLKKSAKKLFSSNSAGGVEDDLLFIPDL